MWRMTHGAWTCPMCRRLILLPPCFIDLTGEHDDDDDAMALVEVTVEVTYIEHDTVERHDNVIFIEHDLVTSLHTPNFMLLGHC